jgi:hypothetical protein
LNADEFSVLGENLAAEMPEFTQESTKKNLSKAYGTFGGWASRKQLKDLTTEFSKAEKLGISVESTENLLNLY